MGRTVDNKRPSTFTRRRRQRLSASLAWPTTGNVPAGEGVRARGRRALLRSKEEDRMSAIYLPEHASRARIRHAERARDNRREIIRELSCGRVTRRDLFKWGLFTSAGLLAPINGLNPFIPRAFADDGNIPRSPLFGVQPFTQPMPRFDVLARKDVSSLNPFPTAEANQTQQVVDPLLGGGTGPIEGRPPGSVWAHQRFADHVPKVAVEATQAPATTNLTYNPP